VLVVNEYYRRAAPSGKENKNSSNQLLIGLEKDHRNLVKHCLNMEEEIKYPNCYLETTSNKWDSSMK
jgi:hypothetical protein